jgi:hypothetical protein
MKKKISLIAASCGTIALLASGVALPALAATSVNGGISGVGIVSGTVPANAVRVGTTTLKLPPIIVRAQTNADLEITRRVNALDALGSRLNSMVRLSATEKGALSSTVQSQITTMDNLQTQIAADVSADATTSLKADIQSITKSYRIFALVIPQGAIEAASDRVLTIVSTMTDLSTKFQARISSASSTANAAGAQATLEDLNAKVADASAQATAANSEVASLVPDNGVASVMQSNTAALKDARSKIQTAQTDLTAAQKDAAIIVKDLRIVVTTPATTTVSASTSVGTSQ